MSTFLASPERGTRLGRERGAGRGRKNMVWGTREGRILPGSPAWPTVPGFL